MASSAELDDDVRTDQLAGRLRQEQELEEPIVNDQSTEQEEQQQEQQQEEDDERKLFSLVINTT